VKRTGANVNAYLILRQGESILLLLRKNTGYLDNQYGFIAGHVEDGESASAAMMREAYEEAGIIPTDLKPIHVLHRQSDRLNIDIFFECHTWQRAIQNREPEKCERLEFFPIHSLSENTIDYAVSVLQCVQRGEIYSERGWESVLSFEKR
jgi:8-oxo-dGTP pyrophosphatase MutT (NUDIX family)